MIFAKPTATIAKLWDKSGYRGIAGKKKAQFVFLLRRNKSIKSKKINLTLDFLCSSVNLKNFPFFPFLYNFPLLKML